MASSSSLRPPVFTGKGGLQHELYHDQWTAYTDLRIADNKKWSRDSKLAALKWSMAYGEGSTWANFYYPSMCVIAGENPVSLSGRPVDMPPASLLLKVREACMAAGVLDAETNELTRGKYLFDVIWATMDHFLGAATAAESANLARLTMSADEDPLAYFRRFQRSYQLLKDYYTPQAAATVFFKGLPAKLRERVASALAGMPPKSITMEIYADTANNIFEQDAMRDGFLSATGADSSRQRHDIDFTSLKGMPPSKAIPKLNKILEQLNVQATVSAPAEAANSQPAAEQPSWRQRDSRGSWRSDNNHSSSRGRPQGGHRSFADRPGHSSCWWL